MSKPAQSDYMGATLATNFGPPCTDSIWDATDGACPAWWRGNDDGVTAVCVSINRLLDGHEPAGRYSGKLICQTMDRVRAMRDAYFATLPVNEIVMEATSQADGSVIYLSGPEPCES